MKYYRCQFGDDAFEIISYKQMVKLSPSKIDEPRISTNTGGGRGTSLHSLCMIGNGDRRMSYWKT